MRGMIRSARQYFDFAPGMHKPKRIRTGAIFVVLTALFLYVIYTRPSIPFLSGGGTELKAEVDFGANVRPGYTPVRVRGVEVGQVTAIERGKSGRGALITLELEKDSGVELKQDVWMALRWRTLLGRNLYVDLHPGSPSAPKWSGGVVPASRNSDPIELDTVLDPLDAKGRKGMQQIITEFDKGFSAPQSVQRSVDAGTPTFRSAAKGLPALRGLQPGDLPKLVANTSRALGELARDEAALANLVSSGAGALGVTAARRADVAATLNIAPGSMRETRRTMVRLEQTLDEVDPLVDDLRPGLDRLPATANSTRRALDVARPLLADLRPTLNLLRPAFTDLQTASVRGVPAFESINETMRMAEDKLVPFLKAKDPATKRPNYQNIGPTASSAGSATSWGDRYGALANFEATVGEDAIDSPCKLQLSNPEATKVACELLVRGLAAALLGRSPQEIKVRDSAVPESKLEKFLLGTTARLTDLVKGKGK